MKTKLLYVLVAVGSFIGLFSGVAFAADAVTPDQGSLLDLAKPVWEQITAGHYLAAAALALVLTVALIKRYAPGKAGTFVHSDVGGALTTLAMSFFGAIATATAAGAAWHWSMLSTAGTIAFAAAGGFALAKKFLMPLLVKIQAKSPAWMQPMFQIVLWIFDKPDATAQATAAGQAAVDAKPAQGANAVVGSPTDL